MVIRKNAAAWRQTAAVTLTLLFVAICLFTGGTYASAADNTVMVKLETSMGDIVLELDKEKAPVTTENFVEYVKEGHYDGTIFHRVIDGFMIQGGGMNAEMQEKSTRKPIQNEADNGLKNKKYSIAMARTPDPNSATAQFFINVQDNPALDFRDKSVQGWGYAVFGKVVKGMDVVDKIKVVATGNKGMHQNVPVEPVVIKKATVE